MFDRKDIETRGAPYAAERAPHTPEERRSAVANSAEFIAERAVESMYPHIVLPVQFEVNGYPDNAEEIARTSTAAAHQAIQGTIATQRPEAN